MNVFLDTNVLVALVTDEPDTAETAASLLDSEHDCLTSLLNLMELRTVLTKKERLELERVQEIQDEITTAVDVVIHDASDMVDANRIQQDSLLYPLDSLILAAADAQDATLVSFDSELQENGAVAPAELL